MLAVCLKLEILILTCKCIFLLTNFIVNKQKKIKKNRRNKHHLPRPTAKLLSFQESEFCAAIKIFNCFSLILKSLRNEKA